MDVKNFNIWDLKEYPNNARVGDVDALAESLKANGQYRPVVVQKSTNYVLAGNHLVKAAQKIGWTKIDAVVVDVDEDAATRIVLSDNRTAELGTYNEEALAELLASLDNFDGTGYKMEDLDDLIASVEEHEMAALPDEEKFSLPPMPNNVRAEATLAEMKDLYAQRARRQVLLEYSNSQYIWVTEQLSKIRNQIGVMGNGDVLIYFLEQKTGESAPNV